MKTNHLPLCFALLLSSGGLARSAPLVLDSFSDGGFNLRFREELTDTDPITLTLVNQRNATGHGPPFWGATLEANIGIARYDLNTNSQVGVAPHLTLDYRNTNSAFSIAPYDAFALEISELTGTALIYAGINDRFYGFSVPMPITQAGTFYYPFTNLSGSYANKIASVQFYVVAQTQVFFIGVDEIAVVPEPCGALLLLTGAGMLAIRRKRAQ